MFTRTLTPYKSKSWFLFGPDRAEICQLLAAIHYNRLDLQLYYWRTNHGAEIDLLICRGDEILFAVEIKSSQKRVKEGLDGVRSFRQEHPKVPVYIVGAKQNFRRLDENITIINWDEFIVNELKV